MIKELYPPIEPYASGTLQVSDLHTIYYEESGDPNGLPVIFLHGGPGGGIEAVYRQYFHPERWRIIIFDQRGCGKSTPFAELRENTTWDLVEDIEKLRRHLDISSWHVFGGSWGSTLALAYAETHPERVKGLILRGIFLVRQSELDWFYQGGCSHIFPDAWEKYIAPISSDQQNRMIEAYYEKLTDSDSEIRLQAARAWSVWEGSTSKLFQNQDQMHQFEEDQFAEAFARIECHYFIHKGFFETENWLLDHVDRIRHIPAVIIQGRYDVVCPMTTAWDLHRAWPEAEFRIVPDAGHSMTEPGIRSELIQAADRFADIK